VGNLDATIHMGYPGSASSLWQQAGRAGRAGRASLAVFVAFNSPLDQLFVRCPRLLMDREAETATIPIDNVFVLRSQLLCAAKESPLRAGDAADGDLAFCVVVSCGQ
jgi:DEAD/DEAH box helicase domain-containing protein